MGLNDLFSGTYTIKDSDAVMPLWYEKSLETEGTPFFNQHISPRWPKAPCPVCDYQLYPLCEADVDRQLFDTVKILALHPKFDDFLKAVGIGKSATVAENDDWTRPMLMFPADEPSWKYQGKEQCIVAGYGYYEPWIPGGPLEDEGEYRMAVYYVPETNPSGATAYREYRYEGSVRRYPHNRDNTTALKEAIGNLLEYIDQMENAGLWGERLRTAVAMLDSGANELHILHNAGLYDIGELWEKTQMAANRRNGEMPERLKQEMELQLHRYAMLSINAIDWQHGYCYISSIFSNKATPKADMDSPQAEGRQSQSYHSDSKPKDYDWTKNIKWENAGRSGPLTKKEEEALGMSSEAWYHQNAR